MAAGYHTVSGRSISEVFQAFGDDKRKLLGNGLYQEAEGIMAQSQPLVPVETGTLRSSGYVEEPKLEDTRVSVELGYGGPAAKINPISGESSNSYAIYVHEDLNAFHPVGSAKYLEIPFNHAKDGMAGRLAEHMQGRSAAGAPFSTVIEAPAAPGEPE